MAKFRVGDYARPVNPQMKESPFVKITAGPFDREGKEYYEVYPLITGGKSYLAFHYESSARQLRKVDRDMKGDY